LRSDDGKGIGLGIGIYSRADVARLARLDPDRVRRWVRGYTFKTRRGVARSSPPVVTSDLRTVEGRAALSFQDLVEILFVKAFLDHGVSLRAIRRAAETATEIFEVSHPFCVKLFETDGRTVIARVYDELGEERMLDLAKKQRVFTQVFSPLLHGLDRTVGIGDASRWWPLGKEKPVVLDPRRALGAAIVLPSSVPTRAIYGAHLAGEPNERIASWFRISPGEVDAAIEFEGQIAGHARAA
jgi:uncharacterized protein (DUF433 family)/DNA-binding transcriptional MerR regulator